MGLTFGQLANQPVKSATTCICESEMIFSCMCTQHRVPGDANRVGNGWAASDPFDFSWVIDMTQCVPNWRPRRACHHTKGHTERVLRKFDGIDCIEDEWSFEDVNARVPDGTDVGITEYILTSGTSGSPSIFADIQFGGFVDLPSMGFSNRTLGVTFTWIFVDGAGNPIEFCCTLGHFVVEGPNFCDGVSRSVEASPLFVGWLRKVKAQIETLLHVITQH